MPTVLLTTEVTRRARLLLRTSPVRAFGALKFTRAWSWNPELFVEKPARCVALTPGSRSSDQPSAKAFFEEAALMMKLPKRHATPWEGGRLVHTNHNCHLARLGVTVVFVKPPQAAYSVHASL